MNFKPATQLDEILTETETTIAALQHQLAQSPWDKYLARENWLKNFPSHIGYLPNYIALWAADQNRTLSSLPPSWPSSEELSPQETDLQAASPPVRICQHCHRLLDIHLSDGTTEPCTRTNRKNCGLDAQGRLIGYRECITEQNRPHQHRMYLQRKEKPAEKHDSIPGAIEGKAKSP